MQSFKRKESINALTRSIRTQTKEISIDNTMVEKGTGAGRSSQIRSVSSAPLSRTSPPRKKKGGLSASWENMDN